MKFLFRVLICLLPWPLRRIALIRWFGFKIDRTARIGWSWVFPRQLVMGPGARIGHLNVIIHLQRVELKAHAYIDRHNWITGFPAGDQRHFTHLAERDPALVLGIHTCITKGHHFDCTDRITIGRFTTIAGYHSQFLSHSIDLIANRQDCAPIVIGDYCFIGTNVVVLGGVDLPQRSVLGAKSLLHRSPPAPGWLHSGVPATPIRELPADAAYFTRQEGCVA